MYCSADCPKSELTLSSARILIENLLSDIIVAFYENIMTFIFALCGLSVSAEFVDKTLGQRLTVVTRHQC